MTTTPDFARDPSHPPSYPPSPPPPPVPLPPLEPRPIDRPGRNHYAVNGRPYLAELDALTTRALELADEYEVRLTAIFDRPIGQVGVR